MKALLVGAKKVSIPCWFSSSVIPAVWIAPTRTLRELHTEVRDRVGFRAVTHDNNKQATATSPKAALD